MRDRCAGIESDKDKSRNANDVGESNCTMIKRMIVIFSGSALLLAAAVAVVVASRNRQQPAPPPDVPVAQTSAEVCVKAVERKAEPMSEGEEAAASGAVAIVCGKDAATADRYEARNDALRSIARRRDLRNYCKL